MELPIYELQILEDDKEALGVDYVGLVDRPAIERNFQAFNDKAKFAVDEVRNIISGPAMLADFPIYRRNADYGEHYVVFTKETIQKIVEKFFRNYFIKNFNLFHEADKTTGENVVLFESFITDTSRGIQPMKGFEDCPEGSWFISAKVYDPEVMKLALNGTVKGFSIEGYFEYAKPEEKLTEEQALKKIYDILNQI